MATCNQCGGAMGQTQALCPHCGNDFEFAEAKPSLFARDLYTAVSAVCGILCVLLIVLWMRSCWSWDQLFYGNARGQTIGFVYTGGGHWAIGTSRTSDIPGATSGWSLRTAPAVNNVYLQLLGFNFQWAAEWWKLEMPFWPFTLITGLIGVEFWSRPRFSLRTLLIATTLIAVVLGLVVWSSG